MIINKFKKLLEWNQWFIAYNFHDEDGKIDLTKFKPLIPPSNCFWADPFLFKFKNEDYIFFEEYNYISTKGHISAFKISTSGQHVFFSNVLKEDFHLAYPQIFEDRGQIYMIPDSRVGLNLYSCKSFPNEWEIEKKILDIPCKDSTLFYDGILYWLFTTVSLPGTQNEESLKIFTSDNLHAEFTPFKGKIHAENINNSRSAGSIFNIGKKLFRPSQDSSKTYGGAININRIIKIDKDIYKEKFVGTINPNWMKGINRTHTFNRTNQITVIDGSFRRTDWKRIFHWRKIFSKSNFYKTLVQE